MRLHTQPLTWILGLAAIALSAFAWLGAPAADPAERVDVDVAYQSASFEQLARESNVVASGQVVRISPTRWNQDDGTYWERTLTDAAGLETIEVALPYYQIEIAPERFVVDAGGGLSADGGPLTLTVVGMSPLDDPAGAGLAVSEQSLEQTAPRVGDRVLVFATPMEIDWLGGSRKVLGPTGAPGQSVLGLAPDGRFVSPGAGLAPATLDDLAARILSLRGAGGTTD
ncbi:MAG: hypothetical protein KDH92_11810 [Chloroflexi bacterium]|nr:hypothetical protein [Chloroflexota bacterium]